MRVDDLLARIFARTGTRLRHYPSKTPSTFDTTMPEDTLYGSNLELHVLFDKVMPPLG
jgi:hypothetical protein